MIVRITKSELGFISILFSFLFLFLIYFLLFILN